MARFPLAPPPLPGEASSLWIARIAARYDLSAEALAGHLLPDERSVPDMTRLIDDRPVPRLEAALAEAARLPEGAFAARRVPGLAERPEAAWSRGRPAWCPVCLFEDVAAQGEVHARAEWGLGCYLLCALHGCHLVSECPRCLKRASYRPVNGRLRLLVRPVRRHGGRRLGAGPDSVLALRIAAAGVAVPHGQLDRRGSATAAPPAKVSTAVEISPVRAGENSPLCCGSVSTVSARRLDGGEVV